MKILYKLKNYFTKLELTIWLSSMTAIIASFYFFDGENILTLIASLIGVTSIIINAKGNPFGQLLMIVFSLFYGGISYSFSYYGEMITYLGMSMPMAIFAFVSWLKHPYHGNKAEVEVNQISRKECCFMWGLAAVVSMIFYFILEFFHTANLVPSTLSVMTSFVAVYLTFRRSPYFSIAYACNDIILIILWILASMEDSKYVSVVVCFIAFLVNDVYGFLSWKAMELRQSDNTQLETLVV